MDEQVTQKIPRGCLLNRAETAMLITTKAGQLAFAHQYNRTDLDHLNLIRYGLAHIPEPTEGKLGISYIGLQAIFQEGLADTKCGACANYRNTCMPTVQDTGMEMFLIQPNLKAVSDV